MTWQTSLIPATCVSPETLCAAVHHLVSAHEARMIEAHLQHCNACLLELQEAMRIASWLKHETQSQPKQERSSTL